MPKDGGNSSPSPAFRPRQTLQPSRASAPTRSRRTSIASVNSRSPSTARVPSATLSAGNATTRHFEKQSSPATTSVLQRDRSKARERPKVNPTKSKLASTSNLQSRHIVSTNVSNNLNSSKASKLTKSQEPPEISKSITSTDVLNNTESLGASKLSKSEEPPEIQNSTVPTDVLNNVESLETSKLSKSEEPPEIPKSTVPTDVLNNVESLETSKLNKSEEPPEIPKTTIPTDVLNNVESLGDSKLSNTDEPPAVYESIISTDVLNNVESSGASKFSHSEETPEISKSTIPTDVSNNVDSSKTLKLIEREEIKEMTESTLEDVTETTDSKLLTTSSEALSNVEPKEEVVASPSHDVNVIPSPTQLSENELDIPRTVETIMKSEQENLGEFNEFPQMKQEVLEYEEFTNEVENQREEENCKLPESTETNDLSKEENLNPNDIPTSMSYSEIKKSSGFLESRSVSELSQDAVLETIELPKQEQTQPHEVLKMREPSDEEIFLEFESSEDSIISKEEVTSLDTQENIEITKNSKSLEISNEMVSHSTLNTLDSPPPTPNLDPVGDQKLRTTTDTAQQTSDAVAIVPTDVKNTQTISLQEDVAVQTTADSTYATDNNTAVEGAIPTEHSKASEINILESASEGDSDNSKIPEALKSVEDVEKAK